MFYYLKITLKINWYKQCVVKQTFLCKNVLI